MLASIGLIVLNLLPFCGVLLVPGWARVPFGVALGCMFLLYAGVWRKVEIEPWYFFLHPVATVLFIFTMLRSTYFALRNGGVEWRGTFYSLAELKKGLV